MSHPMDAAWTTEDPAADLVAGIDDGRYPMDLGYLHAARRDPARAAAATAAVQALVDAGQIHPSRAEE